MSERSTTADDTPREATQLRLLAGGSRPRDWMLDEQTRRIGRAGIQQAREVLRRARPPEPKSPAPVRKAS